MRCAICTHPRRREIETALLSGQPFRRIAARYGMGETSVRRHIANHLRRKVEATKMLDIQTIGKKLEELDGYASRVLQRGEQAGDDRLVLMGVETSGKNLERLHRLIIGSELEQRLKRLEQANGSDDD